MVFTRKMARMTVKDYSIKDKLERWTSTRIEEEQRKMQIFNVYRILESTQSRILKSRVQYDQIGRKVKSSKEYRIEILRDLTSEITTLKSKGIQGIVIIGDIN